MEVTIPEVSFSVPDDLLGILEDPPEDLQWAVVNAVMLCQASYVPMGKAITIAFAQWLREHKDIL